MKILSVFCFENFLAKVIPSHRHRAHGLLSLNYERVGGRIPARFCPTLEILEDRSMPSLIASQVLPLMFPGGPGGPGGLGTVNTVTVLAPALSSSPTGQLITLTDTIAGAPTGGTVNFTVGAFHLADNVPVVNGVAQITIPIRAGTPAGTVTATYTGTTVFSGSTSSGSGNGTLTFCGPGSASTLLGSTLQTYAVLAGSTVTNTGNTVIVGNVGVSPGSATTGFTTDLPPGPGIVTGGTIHRNDGPGVGTAQQARLELTAAIAVISGESGFNLLPADPSGLTLTPGRYRFASSALLTGTLTLNDQGNPAARFDFLIPFQLTTQSGSRVVFINGGADNVYWDVGSSATLLSSSVFAGNILADQSISLGATASIACGRALARVGAVTLIDNFIDPAPQGPIVVVPATAAANLVIGKATRLGVRASDSTGAASLLYTWSTVSSPAGVAPPAFTVNGTNGAQTTAVIFHAAGTYRFRVTITDKNGLSTTSAVTIRVKQSLTSIQVTPSTATVQRSQADPLTARAFDQFGTAMLIQPIFTWYVANFVGSVSSTGMYTAPKQTLGTAIIRARIGLVSGTTFVTVLA